MYSFSSEFLEIVAFTAFVYVIMLAYMGLRGAAIPKWAYFILFVLGVLGLALNGLMIYLTFFVKLSI